MNVELIRRSAEIRRKSNTTTPHFGRFLADRDDLLPRLARIAISHMFRDTSLPTLNCMPSDILGSFGSIWAATRRGGCAMASLIAAPHQCCRNRAKAG